MARQRQASPQVLIGAAGLIVLIVVGIVLALALSGGGSSSSVTTVQGADEVERLLKGIPQRGNVLGSPSAPATLVEYVDLQCPYCQEFETQAMPTLIERYVRTGKAKVEMRILAFIGADSRTGRNAAIAAGLQNKLFDFTQLLYLNQGAENSGWLGDETITAAARAVPGLDVQRLLADRDSAASAERAATFDRLADRDQVNSTPTVLVGAKGQTPQPVALTSAADAESVAAALESAIG